MGGMKTGSRRTWREKSRKIFFVILVMSIVLMSLAKYLPPVHSNEGSWFISTLLDINTTNLCIDV